MTGAVLAAVGSGADVTPDPVNWTDIVGAGTNANQTISGISIPITLRLSQTAIFGVVQYRKNSGAYTSFFGPTEITMSNGDTLNFSWTPDIELGGSGVVSVSNVSGNILLDQFNIS